MKRIDPYSLVRSLTPRSLLKFGIYIFSGLISKSLKSRRNTTLTFRCSHGYRVIDYATHWYLHHIEQHYEAKTFRFLENVAGEGTVIYDVGAGTGIYTIHTLGWRGLSVAIEPFPLNTHLLLENVALNKLDFEKLTLVPLPLCNRSKTTKFHVAARQGQHTIADSGSEKLYSLNIPCLTIDHVYELTNLKPDIVKIDVEDAEIQVLEGAQNLLTEKIPSYLIVETDLNNIDTISNMLKKYGYTLKEILDRLPDSMKANLLFQK